MRRLEFWDHVNRLCEMYNGSVTSGYRSRKRNAQVGGSINSHHLTGMAADVVLDDWSYKDEFIASAESNSIRAVDEVAQGGHLHLHPKSPDLT